MNIQEENNDSLSRNFDNQDEVIKDERNFSASPSLSKSSLDNVPAGIRRPQKDKLLLALSQMKINDESVTKDLDPAIDAADSSKSKG